MDNESKQAKTEQVQDIIRLRLIDGYTYAKITEQVGASRPTARKYIDKFLELVSDEDLALKDSYKNLKRRVKFPTHWKKYVKEMLKDYNPHPKKVSTPEIEKKIIDIATRYNQTVFATYVKLKEELKTQAPLAKPPSYETVAKVLKEHRKE